MKKINNSVATFGFADSVDRMAHVVRPYLMFTALNAVWNGLAKDTCSILDVGCGKGEPMKFINRSKTFYTVGLDIFRPYLKNCKKYGIHDDYILCDAKKLPLRERSFDVVLCSEVLEHLERKNGDELIHFMEKTARKQVIITTPVGEYKQCTFEGNPYQEHKWIWSPVRLKRLGYRVRGVGIRTIGGEDGLVNRLPKIVIPLFHLVWIFTGMLTCYLPSLAVI